MSAKMRERLAEALYEEFRVGCMMHHDYQPMWHEAHENTQRGYRERAARLLSEWAKVEA